MNVKLKAVLVYSLKNAVNATLVALGPIYRDYRDYNLATWHGIANVLVLVGSAIAVREGMVWIPKLWKWSLTNGLEI